MPEVLSHYLRIGTACMDVQTADPDALAEALFGTDERAMRAYAGQRDKAGAPISCIP
jgi:hypothetical protein